MSNSKFVSHIIRGSARISTLFQKDISSGIHARFPNPDKPEPKFEIRISKSETIPNIEMIEIQNIAFTHIRVTSFGHLHFG
ncbi:MAG: hypothetical protein V2B19_27935, partial [Pseudomonadota bacterium]